MKLTSLKLTNFRQHVSTAIQFESGITGIIGPNGSGKTSILEAIAFALYSESRTTRDQMLSQHPIGRGVMRIELEFELGSPAAPHADGGEGLGLGSGFTGTVWAITARVSGSIFRIAWQQGHSTSNRPLGICPL